MTSKIKPSPGSPRTTPLIQVTKHNPRQNKVAPLACGGSEENLIVEPPQSPFYKGQENPVFSFDTATLFRAPSRVAELTPSLDTPLHPHQPIPNRRGSFFTHVPTISAFDDKDSLAVPGSVPSRASGESARWAISI